MPGELHELGSLVVAYRLSRLGHRVTLLGPSLPIADLEQACERLRPKAVCLSVAQESVLRTHLPALVALVKRYREKCLFVVGGEGVHGAVDDLERAGATLWSRDRPLDDLAVLLAQRAVVAPKRRS